MATTYNNCQMGIVDASGNLSVIYPQTKASLVSCDSAKYGGSSNVTDVQNALNNLSTALGNYLPLAGGTMTGSIITPKDDSKGIEPGTANYGQVGSSSKYYYRSYINYTYTETIYLGLKNGTTKSDGYIGFFRNGYSGRIYLSGEGTNDDYSIKLPAKTGTIALTSDLGTAAAKSYTTSVTSGSGDLVTSGGVYSYTNSKIYLEAVIVYASTNIAPGCGQSFAVKGIPSGYHFAGGWVNGQGSFYTELVWSWCNYNGIRATCINPSNNTTVSLEKFTAYLLWIAA